MNAPFMVHARSGGQSFEFSCSTHVQAWTLARDLVFPRIAEPMQSSRLLRLVGDEYQVTARFDRDGVSV